jgi:hypothetical protein
LRIRWARSATKHRITRRQSQFVIDRSGLLFRIPPPEGGGDDRLVYLGDDEEAVPLEVMGVELESGELYVIHAMVMREKYREQYEEAKKWRV